MRKQNLLEFISSDWFNKSIKQVKRIELCRLCQPLDFKGFYLHKNFNSFIGVAKEIGKDFNVRGYKNKGEVLYLLIDSEKHRVKNFDELELLCYLEALDFKVSEKFDFKEYELSLENKRSLFKISNYVTINGIPLLQHLKENYPEQMETSYGILLQYKVNKEVEVSKFVRLEDNTLKELLENGIVPNITYNGRNLVLQNLALRKKEIGEVPYGDSEVIKELKENLLREKKLFINLLVLILPIYFFVFNYISIIWSIKGIAMGFFIGLLIKFIIASFYTHCWTSTCYYSEFYDLVIKRENIYVKLKNVSSVTKRLSGKTYIEYNKYLLDSENLKDTVIKQLDELKVEY